MSAVGLLKRKQKMPDRVETDAEFPGLPFLAVLPACFDVGRSELAVPRLHQLLTVRPWPGLNVAAGRLVKPSVLSVMGFSMLVMHGRGTPGAGTCQPKQGLLWAYFWRFFRKLAASSSVSGEVWYSVDALRLYECLQYGHSVSSQSAQGKEPTFVTEKGLLHILHCSTQVDTHVDYHAACNLVYV